MSMLFLLSIALPAAWATELGAFEEPEYTAFNQVRVGKTKHDAFLSMDVALENFLDMSGKFFAARDEPNSLNEEQIKIVDELFDSFDTDNDNMWSEDEFSEYFVRATRLERVWAQLAGDNDVVEKLVMQEYIERIFTSKATHKISAFVAVTQGLALTSPNMKAYTSEMAESFEYPVTWESFKISQVHAAWVNLPGPKYDGLASEETMINSFFGATKDIANRMEAVEISAVSSDFDTVGDLIEELSGVAERRRASMEEAIADGTMCMFGAIGDVFFAPI